MLTYRTQLMNSAARAVFAPDEPAVAAPVAVPPLPGDNAPTALAEPPKVEEPKVEEPKVEEPKVEDKTEDKTEEPKVEDKTEDKVEDKVEDKTEEPKTAVPEAYELKAPEGDELDAEAVAEATPVFKELGLSNEQAQKIVDLYAGKVLPRIANTVQYETLRLLGMEGMGEWAKQLQADPDVGGAKFEQAKTLVAQARDKFATPELKALLETSRLGNHPEVFKLFHTIGAAIQEGGVLTPQPGKQPTDLAASLYSPEFHPKS